MTHTLASKLQARTLLNEAVRKGVVVKPSACSKCGDTESKIHGHHEDYDKPLEATWLCPTCHGEAHKGKRTITPTPLNSLTKTFLAVVPIRLDEKLREEAAKERRSRQAQLVRILEERYCPVPAQDREVNAA